MAGGGWLSGSRPVPSRPHQRHPSPTRPDWAGAVEIKTFRLDRKRTRLNSSQLVISYAVFCLKKENIDDPRLKQTGARIQQACDQRDPLSPKFQCNLMFGLRFLLAFFFFKLSGHAKVPPPPLPIAFPE